MKKLLVLLICALGLFGTIFRVQAQLVNVSIESLTDQQFIGLMIQNQLIVLSELELEMKAREKGLSMEQINQLKKMLATLDFSTVKEMGAAGSFHPNSFCCQLLP